MGLYTYVVLIRLDLMVTSSTKPLQCRAQLLHLAQGDEPGGHGGFRSRSPWW